MIEAHQFTRRYGYKTAVEDLGFTVRPGIVAGFLGPNGAGKSTTIQKRNTRSRLTQQPSLTP